MDPIDTAFRTRNSSDRLVPEDATRAVSPLVGVLALLVVTVILVAVVAAGVSSVGMTTPPPTAGFSLTVDGQQSTIELEHVGGDSIDVEDLEMTVEINGVPVDEQPPVPFVGAQGFDETPLGPFNAKTESTWNGGESARLQLASTNEPQLGAGDTVTVTLVVDGHRIAVLEETAGH